MTPARAPRVPEGYRLVTRGKVRRGDRVWFPWDPEWKPALNFGQDIFAWCSPEDADRYYARPLPRPARRRGGAQ